MAYLMSKGCKKQDLRVLAEELGVEIGDKFIIAKIVDAIVKSPSYNEEFTKGLLRNIIDDREKEEQRRDREKEEQREEEHRKREFELEKLKLQSKRGNPENTGLKLDLRSLLKEFNPQKDDVCLYLNLFEKQMNFAGISQDRWVMHLIGLLPNEVSKLIVKETGEESQGYQHVKEILLRRFKLNAEKYRRFFEEHRKGSESTWRDFCFDLKAYFEGWISELGIDTFERLKDLLIAEQIKKSAPYDYRDHFIDQWGQWTKPLDLADKLDAYEEAKVGKGRTGDFRPKEFPENFGNRRPDDYYKGRENEQRQPRCYECGSYSHLRPQCELFKRKSEVVASNTLGIENPGKVMEPYTSKGRVNGHEMQILRDTGASLDLVCKKYIKPEMYTNETVWVRSPLLKSLIRLPLAKVELECNLGYIVTKAAVIRDSLDQGRYLLGNRSAALFDQRKKESDVEENSSAVETKVQTRKLVGKSPTEEKIVASEPVILSDEIVLPVIKPEDSRSRTEMVGLSRKEIRIWERKREELKPFLEEAKTGSNAKTKYTTDDGRFFRKEDTNAIPVIDLRSTTVIEALRSPGQHPQSNTGERMHRTFKRTPAGNCAESKSDCEQVLTLLWFVLRVLTHDCTGFLPTKLCKLFLLCCGKVSPRWGGVCKEVTILN